MAQPSRKLAVTLTRHNMAGVNKPDDPSFPFVLDVVCRSPSFMEVTSAFLYGGQEVIRVRGKTLDDIVEFVRCNDLARHIRLTTLTVSVEADDKTYDLFEVNPREQKLAPPELVP